MGSLFYKRSDGEIIPVGQTGAGDGMPVGCIIAVGWPTAQPGWFLLEGQTITNGATLYPTFAAMFPAWVSGNDIVLPNMDGATLVGGAAVTNVTGSMTHTLSIENLAAHTHTGPSHTHTGPSHTHSVNPPQTTTSSNSHTHTTSSLKYSAAITNFGFTIANGGRGPTADTDNPSNSYAHTHTLDIAPFDSAAGGTQATGAGGTQATGSTGTGTPVDHTPKNIKVKFAVKAFFAGLD